MALNSARSGRAPVAGFARSALVIFALTLTLAACGRRGALEPPPDPNAPKQEQAQSDATSNPLGASALPGGAKKKPRHTPPPNRPFILDGLL